MSWCRGDDLTIGVDRHRLLRLDVELDAPSRPNLSPGAMRSRTEGAEHQRQFPEVRHFQAIEIEMSVIDLGRLLHHVAAPVVTTVSHRNLVGFDVGRCAFLNNLRVEPRGPRQHFNRRQRIAEPAETLLQSGI